MNVLVRRPDRLAVQVNGDDGSAKLFYDGKTLTVSNTAKNTYASVAAPDSLQEMMKEVVAVSPASRNCRRRSNHNVTVLRNAARIPSAFGEPCPVGRGNA